MIQKIKKFVDKYKMLQKNDRVLIGLSGGPDSIFLTVILKKIEKLYKIKIFACHIDHQYRKNSWNDAEFVKIFCKKLCIPVDIKKIKLKKFSEERARNLRYKIFEKVAKKYGCNKIATGHTLNDNAETVLMWLARGCGLQGIKGIPPICRKKCEKISPSAHMPVDVVLSSKSSKQIIRPILCISKKEILSYLSKGRINFCIDKTNNFSKFTRNRIRLNIIPQLEKVNPKAVKHIFNLSEILRNKKNVYPTKVTSNIIDIRSKKCYNKSSLKEVSAFFDASKIDIKKIKIRKWRFGDKMVPFGMDGSKKLQDIFTDEKISKNVRNKIPIVCDGKKIIWVAGVKRSNDAKITNKSKEVLKIELKNKLGILKK
ncbi:MAG: tRNA lysidine(34) synthetase TilS [Elusimicrobiota bacterium]